MGVVGAKVNEKRIIQEKLLDDRLCLIMPKDHKWSQKNSIKVEHLLKEPFVIRKHGFGTLKAIRMKCLQRSFLYITFLKIDHRKIYEDIAFKKCKDSFGEKVS